MASALLSLGCGGGSSASTGAHGDGGSGGSSATTRAMGGAAGTGAVTASVSGGGSSAGGASTAGDASSGGGADGASVGSNAGGYSGAAGAASSDADFQDAWDALSEAIDEHTTDAEFTLMLGNASGVFYMYSKGDSAPDTLYESASTSKWVTSAVILQLMDRSADAAFTLDTRPQDLLVAWTDEPGDLRSQIELRELLAFISGLEDPAGVSACTLLGTGTVQSCVAAIYAAAASLELSPGAHFVYGSNHLQVAGLMAMRYSGVQTWGEVFDAFKAETGLFANAVYDLPNTDNPRLAGGMHWTAAEYMEFLGALFNRELLSEASAAAMFSDHTPEANVSIDLSPAREGVAEDWHYGLGVWLECHEPAWQEACGAARRFSSPGAYGAYPFIDFGAGFYGILALQDTLGSFVDGHDLYDDLKPFIDELVRLAP